MRGKARAIGLIATAVMALSGVAAQGAAAADFDSGAGLATITGSGTGQVFSTTGREVTCNIANLDVDATASDPFDGTFNEVTVTPEYTSCTAFGFAMKFTGFGHYESEEGNPTCDFLWRANGTMDLSCEEGGEVTVDAGPCAVHIPPQAGVSGVSYTNTSGKVDVTFNVTLTATHTDGFLCPFEGSGEGQNWSMAGTTLISGENAAGEAVEIAWTEE